jgi:cbb3-type cytochrome oxidase subunit 1
MVGVKLLKISVVYFLLSILLGMYLSISKDFALKGVHVHLALFGWVSLGIAGIIYHLFPSAADHKLGKWHFWLHNLGLPVMMAGLFVYLCGNTAFEPMIAIGSIVAALGVLCFTINVIKNVNE